MSMFNLAALVGSRICHDLVSPLGAIGNGIELLGLSGVPAGPEMELIAESVANANARLRYFRIAYGAAAPGQRLARREIIDTLAAMSRGGRVALIWDDDHGDPVRDEARAVFLALQCLENALPFGGKARVTRTGSEWAVTGQSPRLRVVADLWDSLLAPGTAGEPTAAQVQFALLPGALAGLDRKLALELEAERIVMRF